MTIKKYFIEKRWYVLAMLLVSALLELYLYIFQVNQFLLIFTPILIALSFLIPLIREFVQKKKFYERLESSIEALDHKYLFTEMMPCPEFLEGKIVYETAQQINHNMMDEIGVYKENIKAYKEYIELWVHEIKTPITTVKLMIENNRTPVLTSIEEEIEKMEAYIDQTLYYSRIDMVEQDYRIQKTSLQSIINDCIKANKKSLIANRFSIHLQDLEYEVNTDTKWIRFIINQILVNAIKYRKDTSAALEITARKEKEKVLLLITDYGIGIKEEEVDKVMEKGFVGSNGRKKEATTGMGLYICKKLIEKMHHGIAIYSTENVETTVIITFPLSSFLV